MELDSWLLMMWTSYQTIIRTYETQEMDFNLIDNNNFNVYTRAWLSGVIL